MSDLEQIATQIEIAKGFIARLERDLCEQRVTCAVHDRKVRDAQAALSEGEKRLSHLGSMRIVQQEKLARLYEQFFEMSKG